MGLIALVKLLVQSFDHLAWPVITLVYPLYASIRAIESNCNTQSRKWLTYWILFALILLFEVSIVKINQWLPVWHHVKLITTFWLVVPHCDGAFYVYENILRPCFSVNPTTFVQWFKFRKEEFQIHRTDDFLLLAERYIEENGSHSLEKLIEKSPSLCMEHNLGRIENDAVVRTETEAETTTATILEVNDMKPNVLRIETKAEKVNKVSEAAAAASEEPNSVLDPKKNQKEWTCALCQVTTTGESNLTDHLNGKKHKAKEEERLANMTPTKSRNSSILGTPLYHPSKAGAKKLVSTVRQVANVGVLKGTGGPVEQYNKTRNVSVAEAKKQQPRKDSKKALSTTIGAFENVGFKGKPGYQVEQMNKKKNKVLEKQSSELWCDTCQLMCGSQSTFTSHLAGKKHLNRLTNESMTGAS